jgi:hypothetical protein
MKVFIVLAAACFVSCVSAGHLRGYGAPAADNSYGTVSTGQSSQFREQDSYGNYKFGYDESHAQGRSGRHEERNGHVVRGSYSLADADGRDRTVHYVADASGFRATIHTNEPGVDASRDPAAVLINKEGYAAAPEPEQVAVAAAPVAYRPAAPVAYGPAPAAPHPAAPVYATKSYAEPAPAPAYESAPVHEAAQAFSYSFGTSHPSYAQSYAPSYAPAPAPVYAPQPAAPAPVYQQSIKY